MQFYEQHFNTHHLFHHPHKWFLALLCSPIHFLEMHYKKRYHLQFEHAKKLFVFDMTLLFSAILILGAGLFWYLYNPGVANLVYLHIESPATRVLSGDHVEYKINYKNDSAVKLVSLNLEVQLPNSFVLDKTEPIQPNNNYTFKLPDLDSKNSGSVAISGWLYSTPDKEEKIIATLSYKQESRQVLEEKSTVILKTLRGSLLETTVQLPSKSLANGILPFTITLINKSQQTLPKIILPLKNDYLTFTNLTANQGNVENESWQLDQLSPNGSATLTGQTKLALQNYTDKINLEFAPLFFINNQTIVQNTIKKEIIIAHPQAKLNTAWANEITSIQPGETANLLVNIKNTGNIDLIDNKIEIILPTTVIDTAKILNLNLGQINKQTLILTKNNYPELARITAGAETNLNLKLPIKNWPEGNDDLILKINTRLSANIPDIIGNYETETESPSIKVGTNIALEPEIRYYTNEGDQLGRGPLPLQIGKETKFWALINLTNNTSKASNLTLNAVLPSYVVWTGKSSVSRGQEVKYSSGTKTASWTVPSLLPHETASVNFEIGLTPTAEQLNTTPILVQKINLTATDIYTEKTINQTSPALDASLPNDEMGKGKGVKVVE